MEVVICKEKQDKGSHIIHQGGLTLVKNNRYSLECEKQLLLRQIPTENILIKCAITCVKVVEEGTNSNIMYTFNYDDTPDNYTRYVVSYALTMHFDNNVHEMSHDYYYEVGLFISSSSVDSSHSMVFYDVKCRTRQQISFRNEVTKSDTVAYSNLIEKMIIPGYNPHVCLSIKRGLNKSKKTTLFADDLVSEKNIGGLLFESGFYSDCRLVVGERLFKVHKHVLSSVSPVFAAMFSHDTKENLHSEITIEDSDPATVEDLLLFIYKHKTNFHTEKIIPLYKLAEKYDIENLKLVCTQSFLFSVNTTNVIEYLEFSELFQLTKLKSNILCYIARNEDNIIKSNNYQNYLCKSLSVDTVSYILKMCDRHKMILKDVEECAFNFVKNNWDDVKENAEFMTLLSSHPELIKRMHGVPSTTV